MAISLAGRMVVYAYALEYAFTCTSVESVSGTEFKVAKDAPASLRALAHIFTTLSVNERSMNRHLGGGYLTS